ncbi:hypothetical protein Daus18300_003766 [Diaporthe australafricana]|uniref:Heterokaryon incompatibility domain-containing protein n=1 Tax=Diaporthe australafricana TaxID=127596 RepID=A0ABR3XD81_9PEZI
MGATFSSTKRCGLCYFELPEASGKVKGRILRRYEWRETPQFRATEAYEPFDAPLRHTTLKEIRAKTTKVWLSTDWDGLQESIKRGCRGCQAIADLLSKAADDDKVVLDKKSRLTLNWKLRSSRSVVAGGFDGLGLLEVRMKVRTPEADDPRPTPNNRVVSFRDPNTMKGDRLLDDHDSEGDNGGTDDPRFRIWVFNFDINRADDQEDKRHSHPFAYEDVVAFGDTGSDRSLQQVDDWIRECISTHELCGEEQKTLPDRVLEITPATDDKTPQVRLVEHAGVDALYVCLSHRWGESTPSCRTLKSNLEEHKKNIAWSKLLKTFQDVALVTLRLGLKYVWIDSLCIVQDDADDWKVQAAKMCDIYRRAYVTVGASCSDDSTQGLFRKSSCSRTVKPRHEGPSYVMRRIPEHPTWDQVGVIQMLPELPLLTRSWVYQERLLSARVVHFTRYEVMFECSRPSEGPSYCECHNAPGGLWGGAAGAVGAGLGDLTNGRKQRHAQALRAVSVAASPSGNSGGAGGGGDNLAAVRQYWHQILSEYSGYQISSTSDRLPALAGIARQFGTAHPELGRYVAGMWEHTLAHDLMWFSSHGNLKSRAVHHWRPPHIAPPEHGSFPTWSWIAAGQHVAILSACPRVRPDDLRVVAFPFVLSGPDEYGAIHDASLELEGFVAAGSLVRIERPEPSTGGSDVKPGFQGARGGPQAICPDYPVFTDKHDKLEAGMDIFCMRTGFAWGGKNLVLVLRRASEEGADVFQRIGMINEATRDWMDAAFSETTSKTTIKIT